MHPLTSSHYLVRSLKQYIICINAPIREVVSDGQHHYTPCGNGYICGTRSPTKLLFFSNALLYIAGERNYLTQFPNVALHSDILRIGWPCIILFFIPKSLTHTQQTTFIHIGSKRRVLKWDSQLIKQVWKLIYGQWLHHSKLKHSGEALDDNTK